MGNSDAISVARVELAKWKSVTTNCALSQGAVVEVCGVGGTAARIRPRCSAGKQMTATDGLYRYVAIPHQTQANRQAGQGTAADGVSA